MRRGGRVVSTRIRFSRRGRQQERLACCWLNDWEFDRQQGPGVVPALSTRSGWSRLRQSQWGPAAPHGNSMTQSPPDLVPSPPRLHHCVRGACLSLSLSLYLSILLASALSLSLTCCLSCVLSVSLVPASMPRGGLLRRSAIAPQRGDIRVERRGREQHVTSGLGPLPRAGCGSQGPGPAFDDGGGSSCWPS